MTESLASLFVSTRPTVLATGFTFAEGPVWNPNGILHFSDIRESKRYSLDTSTNEVTLVAENTHGSNGMTLDSDGRLVVCQPGLRRVVAIEDSAEEKVVSARFNGLLLNAPNDIVGNSDGSLFFTNPEGRISGADAEIGYSGVYRISPDGETFEVCAGMNLPNGLAFSPDESRLYVSNTRPNPKLFVFDMNADGTADNGRIVDEMPLVDGTEKNGVPDGLKVDSTGRIFCTGPGGIWVWDADESHIGILEFPEVTTNIAWGGVDLKTMYVTAHTSIYQLETITPGTPLAANTPSR